MKVIKNNIKLLIGFIFGIIISISLTVCAYTLQANEIGYTKSGVSDVTNVQQALNKLYDMNKESKELNLGYAETNSDASICSGVNSPYMPNKQTYLGYGADSVGWFADAYLNNIYNAYHFQKKVCINHVRLAYGVVDSTTWMQEGDVTIQASNDKFSSQIVDLATVHIAFDDNLPEGKYGVYWEGDIDNTNEYFSYRVIAKDSDGYTGVNKLQLTYISYTTK